MTRSFRNFIFFIALFLLFTIMSPLTSLLYWFYFIYWWLLILLDHPRTQEPLFTVGGMHPLSNFIYFFTLCEPFERAAIAIHNIRFNRPKKINTGIFIKERSRAYFAAMLCGLPLVYFRIFNTILAAYLQTKPVTVKDHLDFLNAVALS